MKAIIFCMLMALLLLCDGCATTADNGVVYTPKFKISCMGIDLHCEYVPQ